jgi:hypothetical protein
MSTKNLKIVKSLKSFSSEAKWLTYASTQGLKARHIDFLIPGEIEGPEQDAPSLEQMVRQTMMKEFSPKVRDLKSYENIVEATMNRLLEG